MKKIVASVGLVALGASGIQTASAQDLASPSTAKPWNVQASLRGFYDDNVNGTPNNQPVGAGEHRGSFGFEVSPAATLNWTLEQTTLSFGVLYSLKVYEHKPIGNADNKDQDFTFNLFLKHAFSERQQIQASDSFVIGQEPDMLRAGTVFNNFNRISGDNIRNYGKINYDLQVTPVVGASVSYDNAYYDYSATGPVPTGNNILASPAGELNRIEQGFTLEGLWTIQPTTKGIFGYRFHETDYTGDEFVSGTLAAANQPVAGNVRADLPYLMSNGRNSREHTVYVGAEHSFRPDWVAKARVGASYFDYYNSLTTSSSFAPYVSASTTYTYAPESSFELGVSYDRSATDLVGNFANGGFTSDAESVAVYATVSHRITPHVYGNLTGQFQNSTYNGGAFDSLSEQYYLAGLNLEYRFNQFVKAEVGYNYDKLASDSTINRAFDRNRVYIGVTASY
jgi:hypothetical protein